MMKALFAHTYSWPHAWQGLLMGLLVSGFPFVSWYLLLKRGLPLLTRGKKTLKPFLFFALAIPLKLIVLFVLMILVYEGRFFLNLFFLGSLLGFPLVFSLLYFLFFRPGCSNQETPSPML